MAYAGAKHRKSRKGGFMVISFVIALSLAMFATLRSLAIMSAEQSALSLEMEGRTRADQIALDCIYVYARILTTHGSMDRVRSVRIPVADGSCLAEDLDETPAYDMSGYGSNPYGITGRRATGIHASFVVHADTVRGDAHGAGASGDGSARNFHSRIHAEIRIVDGAIDLIRI